MNLMPAPRCFAALLLLASACAARAPEVWMLARGSHFEIYANGGPHSAPDLLAAFERMHAFFARLVGVEPDPKRPIRVICFGTRQEYGSYRLQSNADAFYIGTESRDYIVMPALAAGDFHTAAHEYAHLLVRSSGLTLPRWIAEGIAEVASTVQLREHSSSIGGDLPARSRLLRSGLWLPLSDLFGTGEKDASTPAVFYAESWALTAMLMLSPKYSPRFRLLLGSLVARESGEAALRAVCNRSAETVARDLRAFLAHIPPLVPLPGIGAVAAAAQPVSISPSESRAMLADLRLASGDLDGAEAMYRALGADTNSADAYAGLGLVELRKENTPAALAAWQRALELGVADAGICYRYAVLADLRNLPAIQVRAALEKAITLQPDFDDAHFKLALMDKNGGQPQAAIDHLRAMRQVPQGRQFSFWSVMAEALLDVGRREDGRAAARQALEAARSDTDRENAAGILYMADTDLAVQLTSGPDGPHFRAIRVPHGQPERNPFVEPGDAIQRAEATLQSVDCSDTEVRIGVRAPSGEILLSVPDPSRVQIRNTPGVRFEFTCGAQAPRNVLVEYNKDHVLRGLELR